MGISYQEGITDLLLEYRVRRGCAVIEAARGWSTRLGVYNVIKLAVRQVPALDAPYSGAGRKSSDRHRMCRIKGVVARSTAHPMQNQKRWAYPRNEAHHSRKMPRWLILNDIESVYAIPEPGRYQASHHQDHRRNFCYFMELWEESGSSTLHPSSQCRPRCNQ